jgi:hypothetical protein
MKIEWIEEFTASRCGNFVIGTLRVIGTSLSENLRFYWNYVVKSNHGSFLLRLLNSQLLTQNSTHSTLCLSAEFPEQFAILVPLKGALHRGCTERVVSDEDQYAELRP